MALIKCPGCGQRISSQSITCPNCSIRIKGNIRQCLHCQEWMLANKAVCTACGFEMTVQGNAEGGAISELPNHFKTKNVAQPKKNKSGCVGIFVFLSILGVVLGSAIFVGYRYHLKVQKEKNSAREALFKRIADDKRANDERLLQMQLDSSYWHKALKAKTLDATEAYINAYPEGIFIHEAYMLLEELKRRQVTSAEETLIRHVVEEKLKTYQDSVTKRLEADVLGIHSQIIDKLNISKKYIHRDSFQYLVRGKVQININRTDSKKINQKELKLEMVMDSDRKVIASSL